MRGDGADRERPERATGERAVYVISVAAELAGVHPQTLRDYERKGLVQPKRSSGNTRRYSQRDIELLQQIQELTQRRGVNLAGVKLIMELQSEIETLLEQVDELERQLRVSRRASRRRESVGSIVPLRKVILPPWEVRP